MLRIGAGAAGRGGERTTEIERGKLPEGAGGREMGRYPAKDKARPHRAARNGPQIAQCCRIRQYSPVLHLQRWV